MSDDRSSPSRRTATRGGRRGAGVGVYRGATRLLSVGMIAVGLAALVRTAAAAGLEPAVGYLIGAGLVVAGVLRLVILRRTDEA